MPRGDHIYKIQGVILRRRDLGEADRILTLFTRERGKLRLVAKGVRKPTSRKAGFVELFSHVSGVASAGTTLDILTQVDTLDAYITLRNDLDLMSYASHFCELVDSFTEDDDANPSLYTLLSSSLGYLDAGVEKRLVARFFELHLLRIEGFQPEIGKCVLCGRELEPVDQFFSVRDGGVVCPSCGEMTRGFHPLSLGCLKVLRNFLREDFGAVRQLTISEPVQRELEQLLFEMLTYTLEKRLKSAAFIRRLRREESG